MKLTFELDVPPLFENNKGQISVKQEIFELVYNTGAITGSTGQGSLHQVFNNNARIYFLTGGGTQNMATLLKNENIGSIMRYDASMVKWRIYNPVTGIWDLSVSFVEVSKVSDFLDRILTPILYLAEFAGPTVFDWISRTHKPLSADDDVNDDNDDADKPVKKKKTCNSAFAGEISVRDLKTTILTYVQTPKNTTEVIKQLVPYLHVPFHDMVQKDRLVCPNGVVNLRTGELLPIAKPEDFFTMACVTLYDPNACMEAAIRFFQAYFPIQAYEDQAEYVQFMKEWWGYTLTGETTLEEMLWLYGVGSNGKSKMIEFLSYTLGNDIHHEIPMAALCKIRGINNDSLYDARQARCVTISESDSKDRISEGALRSLVSGEKQTLKTMYGKEQSQKSNMKLTAMVNNLPPWENPNDLNTLRRNTYIYLKVLFVKGDDEASKKLVKDYREDGVPEYLLADKDNNHFINNIEGNAASFLRFMVSGAQTFYANGKIAKPSSLTKHQYAQKENKDDAVLNYVDEYLHVVEGEQILQRNIFAHFRQMTSIDIVTLNDTALLTIFTKTMEGKADEYGGEWRMAHKKNTTSSSGKGKHWVNLAFKKLL